MSGPRSTRPAPGLVERRGCGGWRGDDRGGRGQGGDHATGPRHEDRAPDSKGEILHWRHGDHGLCSQPQAGRQTGETCAIKILQFLSLQIIKASFNENSTLILTIPEVPDDFEEIEEDFPITEEVMWILFGVNITILTSCLLCSMRCLVSRCRGRGRSFKRRHLYMVPEHYNSNNNSVLRKERSLKRKAPNRP